MTELLTEGGGASLPHREQIVNAPLCIEEEVSHAIVGPAYRCSSDMSEQEPSRVEISIVDDIDEISASAWDALVLDGNPFVSHAWLRAMEVTQCAAPEEGWMPQHLVARLDGEVVGAVPLYVKGNSYGEYVYDWAWADLAARMGVHYYPKVIAASPFSPVSGSRLLVGDREQSDAVRDALAVALRSVGGDDGLSGVHVLFCPEPEARALERRGFVLRTAHQYHWFNHGYASFDEFLARFRSKRRREIRRERRRVQEAGYRVEVVRGDEATVEQMDDAFSFYASTCDRYVWGRQYLNREFFEEVQGTMSERIRLFFAQDSSGRRVAGTFNLAGPTRLFGRYWGARVEVPHLHFETCYYRMIEVAIEEGLEAIEPGAGGDHKYARGFEPVTTWSAHHLTDPQFDHVIRRYLSRERDAVECMVDEMKERGPLRADVPAS